VVGLSRNVYDTNSSAWRVGSISRNRPFGGAASSPSFQRGFACFPGGLPDAPGVIGCCLENVVPVLEKREDRKSNWHFRFEASGPFREQYVIKRGCTRGGHEWRITVELWHTPMWVGHIRIRRRSCLYLCNLCWRGSRRYKQNQLTWYNRLSIQK